MNDEEIIRLLIEVEERFPVETWRIDGVPIWPLVRCAISGDNFHMFERVRAPLGLKKLGAAIELLRGPVHKVRAERQDRQNDRWRSVDALLFSDGVSTALVDGKYYERFCDPVKSELARRGYESLIITRGARFQTPRYSPSIAIQPTIDLLRVRARLSSVRTPPERSLDGFEDATRWMRQRHPEARFRDVPSIAHSATYLRHMERYFAKMLARTNPKVVFTVCYYGLPSMAALLACHRRGIPTVDIQHGCINDLHQAYAHWSRLPPGGYDVLPRYFWCWNESAVRTIERWSGSSGGAHAALHGGNLFREIWRDDSNPLVARFATEVDSLSRSAGGSARILYTCNAFETEAEVQKLATCIRKTEGRAFWFVRLHPCSKETAASRSAALLRHGASAFHVHDAPRLPLYALLRTVDLHVTEGSSSTDEAAEFGVPSLLLSAAEAPLFKELIEQGWVTLVSNIDELSGTVERQIERGRQLRSTRPRDSAVDLQHRLDRIFDTLMK